AATSRRSTPGDLRNRRALAMNVRMQIYRSGREGLRAALRAVSRLTILPVLVLAAALAGCDSSESDPSDPDAFDRAFEQQLETTVTTLFEELDVPGALVGLWVPGRGSWTTSLGVADPESGEPFAFENHVRLGSITKTFTVTLILQLSEEGLLGLEDPVSAYFDTDPASTKLTLEQANPG